MEGMEINTQNFEAVDAINNIEMLHTRLISTDNRMNLEPETVSY